MLSSVGSWRRILLVAAASALLVLVTAVAFDAAFAGKNKNKHGGGGGQGSAMQSCPPGLIPSKKGCKPPGGNKAQAGKPNKNKADFKKLGREKVDIRKPERTKSEAKKQGKDNAAEKHKGDGKAKASGKDKAPKVAAGCTPPMIYSRKARGCISGGKDKWTAGKEKGYGKDYSVGKEKGPDEGYSSGKDYSGGKGEGHGEDHSAGNDGDHDEVKGLSKDYSGGKGGGQDENYPGGDDSAGEDGGQGKVKGLSKDYSGGKGEGQDETYPSGEDSAGKDGGHDKVEGLSKDYSGGKGGGQDENYPGGEDYSDGKDGGHDKVKGLSKDYSGGKDGGPGKDKWSGKNNGPEITKCSPPNFYSNRARACVKPRGPEIASCYWPMVRVGYGCVCAPGFIPRGGQCWQPPVVPVGPVPGGPPQILPVAPPPLLQARPGLPPAPAAPALQRTYEPKPETVAAPVNQTIHCLPDDLYELMEQTYGKRPGLDRCPTACLPKPGFFTPAELDAVAEKGGIEWCENCLQVGSYMPLAAIRLIEQVANVSVCVNPDMCRLPVGIGGPDAAERETEIRTVFRELPKGVDNEDNIAVVVGNRDYQGELPDNSDGHADAEAVVALLTDQLGYKQENIIDLRDATLADLERVFGSDDHPAGEIAERIDKDDPGELFVYIASHGLADAEDGKDAYLLPIDARLDDLDDSAYPLQDLYKTLGKTGARTTMLMLEVNFAKNLDELIDPPNLPELEVEAMPADPVPGLAVFKASDRDQKAIQDPEYGIGLFTRYLIEGLAGRADEAPIGNDDKKIDTVELYVYTADSVRTAARKSFGLEQKPLLSKIDNLVVGTLAAQ